MGRDNRSNVISMMAAMAGMGGAIHKQMGKFSTMAMNFDRHSKRYLAKLKGGGRIHGRSYKPNGPKECARRVAQMNRWPSNIPMEQRRVSYVRT